MRYTVIIPRSVQRRLDRVADDIRERVLRRLVELESQPRPADVKKLKAGTRGEFEWVTTA